MTSYHWLKLWIDILDDWKIAPLPDRLWRRFIECCLIAKRLDDGGFLDTVERMAFFLRLEPDEMEQDLIDLERATRSKDKPGVVQKIDGRWFVTNLDKRQSRMTPTQRKRKQRERDREVSRNGHATVTESDHRGTEDRQTEEQRTEEQTTDNRGAGAPHAVVVAALESFGMGQPEKVIDETQLSTSEIMDTIAYAAQEELGAGWVRTQLRENRTHRPRAPDDYWRKVVEGQQRRRSAEGGPPGVAQT